MQQPHYRQPQPAPKAPTMATAFNGAPPAPPARAGAPPPPPISMQDRLAALDALKVQSDQPLPFHARMKQGWGHILPSLGAVNQADYTTGPMRDDPGNSVFSGISDYASVFPVKQPGPPPDSSGVKKKGMATAFEG